MTLLLLYLQEILQKQIKGFCWKAGPQFGKCTQRWQRRKTWRGPESILKCQLTYQFKSHCGDQTIVRSSYLHNEIFYTDTMASWYWTNPSGCMWSAYVAKIIFSVFRVGGTSNHNAEFCVFQSNRKIFLHHQTNKRAQYFAELIYQLHTSS